MWAKGKKLGIGALVALSLGLAAMPARATSSFELVRRAGEDRYKTAQVLANEGFPGGATTAIVVRGDGDTVNFADALASSFLAGGPTDGAPILLTARDELPEVTANALEGLGVTTVWVLGGPAAVSDEVFEELDATYEATRISGVDRFATAAAAAGALPADSVGTVDGRRTAILANGRTGLVDALAAGPIAYNQRLPILLTESNFLPDSTAAALDELDITHVVLAGGTSVISSAVDGDVKATGATTERVGGADRYGTATMLADFALDEFADWSDTAVDVASGVSIADALSGGPVAGKAGRPIVLANRTGVPAATANWLTDQSPTLESGRAFGGTAVLPESVLAAVTAAARGGGATSAGTVVSVDRPADTYRFVPTDASEATSVTYLAGDSFHIGGQPATFAAFEAALNAADEISHTTATASTPASHRLTDVNPASITSGTVGNVDTEANQFDFIHPDTGDALRQDVGYASGTYRVDGDTELVAGFEADLNEGDTLVITVGEFSLTNADVVGIVSEVVPPPLPVVQTTGFKIGGLGDVPGSGEAGDDSHYEADGGPGATDDFSVDADADATYGDFAESLSVGDRVTYRREGGVETMLLVNLPPAPSSGQAVDDLNPDGDSNPVNGADSDGGSFTLATSTGSRDVTYVASGQFVVNGAIATERDFESAYSAGDRITFRPADTPSGTTQRLELTSGDLAGPVKKESVNTSGSATPGQPSRPAKSYAVLAENGTTELATVLYADGAEGEEKYVVNGITATLQQFEAELNAITAGTKTGSVGVQQAAEVQTHRLTTNPV